MADLISAYFPFSREEVTAASRSLGASLEEAEAEAEFFAEACGGEDGWFGFAATDSNGWPLIDALAALSPEAAARAERFRFANTLRGG